MNITQGFKMAWGSIRSNKMRSFLTMLGIIIGVGAVISLVTLGQGATANVKKQIESLGTNLLTVNIFGRGAKTTLSYQDALTLSSQQGVEAVAPVVSGNVTVKNGSTNDNYSVDGITQDYGSVRNFKAQAGRFILPIDVSYRMKVAVIGTSIASEFFPNENPVGQTLQLNGIDFKVVGLLEQKGDTMQGNQDESIFIPISTSERLLRSKGVRQVYVQADSSNDVDMVQNELDAFLQKKIGGTIDPKRGFNTAYRVFNQQQMLTTVNSITKSLTMALGGIAGISLLVGGIGIMNIMLVSVTERTREIGIRKAIGARRRDILLQFLIESMVLGGCGGVIGILVGTGSTLTISKVFKMTVVFSPQIVLISFLFSLAVGVFFGLFPANKAAKLKPIEALRTD